jgi:hypothetical protein
MVVPFVDEKELIPNMLFQKQNAIFFENLPRQGSGAAMPDSLQPYATCLKTRQHMD